MSGKAGDSGKGGWFKALLGTLAGLLSGAVLTYLTPIFDKVVKPPRPVANFSTEADGLTVTFQDRSSGGAEGWWDFGDGSPLEPVVPDGGPVTHTYANPGTYTAKMLLRNRLGDENERAVPVPLETARGEPPSIPELDVTPVSPGSYAPATFRVSTKVKNAQLVVWDLGDDRPLEISPGTMASQERLVTFDRPGGYMIQLAAVHGMQSSAKSDIAQVNVPPPGMLTAILSVTDQATRVETLTTPWALSERFPPQSKEDVYKVSTRAAARQGYAITDVRLTAGKALSMQGKTELAIDPTAAGLRGARNLRLQLTPNRGEVKLTGELVRVGKNAPPNLALRMDLIQEKRSPVTRPAVPVTATLAVPGVALLALPPVPGDWAETKRQFRLELRDGDRILWQEKGMPRGVPLTFRNRRYTVNAVQTGEQVRLDVTESAAGLN